MGENYEKGGNDYNSPKISGNPVTNARLQYMDQIGRLEKLDKMVTYELQKDIQIGEPQMGHPKGKEVIGVFDINGVFLFDIESEEDVLQGGGINENDIKNAVAQYEDSRASIQLQMNVIIAIMNTAGIEFFELARYEDNFNYIHINWKHINDEQVEKFKLAVKTYVETKDKEYYKKDVILPNNFKLIPLLDENGLPCFNVEGTDIQIYNGDKQDNNDTLISKIEGAVQELMKEPVSTIPSDKLKSIGFQNVGGIYISQELSDSSSMHVEISSIILLNGIEIGISDDIIGLDTKGNELLILRKDGSIARYNKNGFPIRAPYFLTDEKTQPLYRLVKILNIK